MSKTKFAISEREAIEMEEALYIYCLTLCRDSRYLALARYEKETMKEKKKTLTKIQKRLQTVIKNHK